MTFESNDKPADNQPVFVCLQGGCTYKNAKILTADEIKALLKKHGFDSNSDGEITTSGSMTLGEFMDIKFKKRPFLIKPLLKEGQTIMIKARSKHFKSWIGYEIAACAASGGSMGGRFHAPNPTVVLLVDAEMIADELQDRFQSIMGLYESSSLLLKNLRVTSLEFEDKKIDLTNTRDQAWLEEFTIDAKVIVLDNLGLLMPDGAVTNVKAWRIVRNWTKKMNKQGKSIVIIHHETKEGKTGGTSKIGDDLDLVVALKKPENKELADDDVIEFRFQESRSLKGSEKAPFYIRYYEENGVFKRDIQDIDHESGEPVEVVVSEEEIKKYNLDTELKYEIFTAAITGKVFKRKTFESGEKGHSSSIIKKCLKEFCDKNVLEKNGYEYQLHPDRRKIYG